MESILYIILSTEIAILFGLLGSSGSHPLDPGVTASGIDYGCRTYNSYLNVLNVCGSNSHYGLGSMREIFVSVDTMKTAVHETCFPNYLNYTQCVLELTGDCEVADRALLLNEMHAYYERCQNNSWIYEYALNGYANVDLVCLRMHTPICFDEPLQYRYVFPNSNTPLAEGIEFMRTKTYYLFDCLMTNSIKVLSKRPGCSSTWEDILFTILIGFINVPPMRLRMFPEQIGKIQEIRNKYGNMDSIF